VGSKAAFGFPELHGARRAICAAFVEQKKRQRIRRSECLDRLPQPLLHVAGAFREWRVNTRDEGGLLSGGLSRCDPRGASASRKETDRLHAKNSSNNSFVGSLWGCRLCQRSNNALLLLKLPCCCPRHLQICKRVAVYGFSLPAAMSEIEVRPLESPLLHGDGECFFFVMWAVLGAKLCAFAPRISWWSDYRRPLLLRSRTQS